MRILIMVSLVGIQSALAGFEQKTGGGRSAGVAGTYAGAAADVWSMFFNVGGLARLARNEASFYYSPQPFGVRELSFAAAAVGVPIGFGVIGCTVSRYGFDAYREITSGISFSRSFSELGVGISLNYYSVAIRNYGSAATFGIDVGAQFQLNPELSSGISVRNLNSPTIGAAEEKLPQLFSTGLTCRPVPELNLLADYRKESGCDASPRFGIEYLVSSAITLRCGVSDIPSNASAGIGIEVSRVRFDYALSHHQELGWSHQGSLSIEW